MDLFSHVFHMLLSYLITEVLILECLYLHRQFRYRWLKNIWSNKRRVMISTGGLEKNSKFNKRVGEVYLALRSSKGCTMQVSYNSVCFRAKRFQWMCASNLYVFVQKIFMFENFNWTAPCVILIFHLQEDLYQC